MKARSLKKPKKRKKASPLRPFPVRWVVIPLIIILAGGTAVVLLESLPGFDLFKGVNLGEKLGLVKREKRSVSEIVLRETREVFSLATVEYIHKAVFPYDFASGDGSWDAEINRSVEKRRRREQLSPGEERNLALYLFCLELGLNPGSPDYDFVVVTSIITAGYGAETEGTEDKPLFTYSSKEDLLVLNLPEPEITSFTIEDSTYENYGYPDIDITPEEWRILTDFIREEVLRQIDLRELFTRARENTIAFLRVVLSGAGFENIQFRKESIP